MLNFSPTKQSNVADLDSKYSSLYKIAPMFAKEPQLQFQAISQIAPNFELFGDNYVSVDQSNFMHRWVKSCIAWISSSLAIAFNSWLWSLSSDSYSFAKKSNSLTKSFSKLE